MSHRPELSDATWTTETIAELVLHYSPGMPRIGAVEPRMGTWIGSGIGTSFGPILNGTVTWDLFEVVSPTLCAANLLGRVHTTRGVAVRFEGLGFLQRPHPHSRLWIMSGGVVFESENTSLPGLAGRPAVWEGVFDAGTLSHRYRLYRWWE